MDSVATPTFFATPAEFRAWLERNHDTVRELLVGFYKKGSGRPSITWPESVDEALCFGWIDGVRKSIDAESYTIRFTPRKAGSIWSAMNTKRAAELIELGRMRPAGLAAFEKRDERKTNRYSFEREHVELDAAQQERFRANARAWAFFQAQAPSYRKVATWWVVSAQREATREKRLATLIADSEAGRRIGPLRRDDRAE
ncbi:MAG TPA: YdeI/OmpD-associated family protein [Longimicrobiales bacterium]|nr:YdeI/OmpD-associated family protein [Longimicrobiales bacterium]